MAEQGELKAHRATYGGFLSMVKWGSVIVAIRALGVVLLIAP